MYTHYGGFTTTKSFLNLTNTISVTGLILGSAPGINAGH
jgi:hypothetical protein